MPFFTSGFPVATPIARTALKRARAMAKETGCPSRKTVAPASGAETLATAYSSFTAAAITFPALRNTNGFANVVFHYANGPRPIVSVIGREFHSKITALTVDR